MKGESYIYLSLVLGEIVVGVGGGGRGGVTWVGDIMVLGLMVVGVGWEKQPRQRGGTQPAHFPVVYGAPPLLVGG